MSISDLIATESAAAERNPNAAIKPGSKVTRSHNRAKTLQVRLNVEELDALTLLAEQRGVPFRRWLVTSSCPATTAAWDLPRWPATLGRCPRGGPKIRYADGRPCGRRIRRGGLEYGSGEQRTPQRHR